MANFAGLSPRVRGKPPYSASTAGRNRSIPACAGEATGIAAYQLGYEVYPRVCGGSPTAPSGGMTAAGLSPRVRGKRLNDSIRYRLKGSIPACAGEAPYDSR